LPAHIRKRTPQTPREEDVAAVSPNDSGTWAVSRRFPQPEELAFMTTPTRRLIHAEDLFALRLVSDPQMSPDGTRIAFVLQRTDLEKNEYVSNLWLVAREGGEPRPFTTGDARDSAPRWSPDGRWLAFLSDRDETSQVWLIAADGGEARKLTSLPEGTITPPVWSPDGARLLFAYRPLPPMDTKTAREELEKSHRSPPPRVIRRFRYREEGHGFFDDERWHLWTVGVAGGETRQLTQGETDETEPTWSPDGRWIAFISNRAPDPDLAPNAQDLWVIPADGGGVVPPRSEDDGEQGAEGAAAQRVEPRRLEAPAGPKSWPTWSPNGSEIAYLGHARAEEIWGVTNPSLWRASTGLPGGRAGGPARDVTADLDRPLGDTVISDVRSFGGGRLGPLWTPEGGLLFLVSDSGSVHLYQAAAGDERRLVVSGPREVAAVTGDREGRHLALLIGSPWEPGDVFTLTVEPAAGAGRSPEEPRRLTAVNRALLEGLRLAEPEELRVSAPDGIELHGWLLRPPEADAGSRPPLILQIHGGPHTQYGHVFFHEMQWLAARGYCVLYTNPRGSKGYGEAFTAGVRGRWGEADFGDLMAMVDAVVARGDVDPQRLGVTGGSYGGFMTNWIVSHTDRFRAAVTQRSVTNLMSMAGTCDFAFDDHNYFDANAWDDPGGYLRLSPLTYAAQVRTPLLILHSEGDLRCPIEQAEQWFAALKRLGREVEFVRFPREANHGLSRSGPPDLRLERLNWIVGWMDRYLK
jgi:dipeptidyl aminopeptidase/acylaminoacyl peptidase